MGTFRNSEDEVARAVAIEMRSKSSEEVMFIDLLFALPVIEGLACDFLDGSTAMFVLVGRLT